MNHDFHASDVDNFTGREIVHSKTEIASNAKIGDINPQSAQRKDLGEVT